MGTRGPLPTSSPRRRNARAVVVQLDPGNPLPLDPPADFGPAGIAVWEEAGSLAWIKASDRISVEQLGRLEDEAAEWREVRDDRGLLLSKPVVTPKGEVVGEEVYANPATAELRKIERSAAELRKALGMAPLYRAHLGIAVVEAETGAQRLARMRSREISEDDDPWANDPRLRAVPTLPSGRSSATGSKSTSSTARATSKAKRSSSTTSSARSSGAATKSTRKATRARDGGSTAAPS